MPATASSRPSSAPCLTDSAAPVSVSSARVQPSLHPPRGPRSERPSCAGRGRRAPAAGSTAPGPASAHTPTSPSASAAGRSGPPDVTDHRLSVSVPPYRCQRPQASSRYCPPGQVTIQKSYSTPASINTVPLYWHCRILSITAQCISITVSRSVVTYRQLAVPVPPSLLWTWPATASLSA